MLPAAALAEMTVQTFPVDGTELDPQSARRTTCPTIDAIKNVSNGSQILVASHTSAIYQIMGPGVAGECTGFGIDISDDDIFPKDDRGSVPRAEYGFIWKFSIDAEGNAQFLKRIDFKLNLITRVERDGLVAPLRFGGVVSIHDCSVCFIVFMLRLMIIQSV